MKNRAFTLLCILLLGSPLLAGCDKWLDVTPQAQVNADKLFSTPTGFESALYGIYTSLTDPSLYGTHLTFGMNDVLAQYYNVHNNRLHNLYEMSQYNYGHSSSQSYARQTWLKAYNSIANCNIMLEYLSQRDPSFFEAGRYALIMAETKALRAYLHFDLLRLFAPSWSSSPDALCLPYADNFTDRVHRQRKTSDIIADIITDLEDARAMLKPVDPAREEKFKDVYYHYQSDPGEEFISYRAYRLNYWAVTGLLARVYHYKGDKQNAYERAKEVIEAGEEGFFPFTLEEEVSAQLTNRDVVMKNELLFALSYSGVNFLWYQYDSSTDSGFTINDLQSLYPVTDDFRRQYLVIKNSNNADVSVKYADVKSSKGGKIPMIRLSEMYLIAAEAGFDDSKAESVTLLETLRRKRGVVSTISPTVTRDEFLSELTTEARREFLGEGQLFYWYKRLGLPVQQGKASLTLTPVQFCLPLPSAEVEFGNRKEDYIQQLN